MQYTILDFAKSLDLDHCKIQDAPDLLFLCGGPMAEAGSGSYLSARDFFYRSLKEKPALAERIRLAEEVNARFSSAWLDRENPFSDLLEVENHIAHLSSATVLFVESAGSIAEFGAFAASNNLRRKTVAILNDFHSQQSFIWEGPVRILLNENENHVLRYRWDPEDLTSEATLEEFDAIAGDLVSFIEERDAGQAEQVQFQREQDGHIPLLVADLVWFLGVALRSDIINCLAVLGMDGSIPVVNRYLRILESVDLVKRDATNTSTSLYSTSPSFGTYQKYARYRDKPGVLIGAPVLAQIRQKPGLSIAG